MSLVLRGLPTAALAAAMVWCVAARRALTGEAEAPGVKAISGASSGGSGFLPEDFSLQGGVTEFIHDDDGKTIGFALLNYATINSTDLSLTARNILIRPDASTGGTEIYAEGDVLFTQKGRGTFSCDRFIFDYPAYQGFAVNARVRSRDASAPPLPGRSFLATAPSVGTENFFANSGGSGFHKNMPLNATATELRILSRDHIELIDVDVSPDNYAEPHYRFHLPAALLRRHEKVEAYNATLRIGPAPIFYLPYFIRDLQYPWWPWMSFTAGTASDWGVFAKTQWGFDLPTDETKWRYMRPDRLLASFDVYAKRGIGLGGGLRYIPDADPARRSRGEFGFYNIYENWTRDSDDEQRAQFDNVNTQWKRHKWQGQDDWTRTLYGGTHRTSAYWNHYQELNDRWTLLADARYYSDADMPWEYDRRRYENDRPPTAALAARRLDDDWALTVYAQKRINDWQTQAEYLPELRLSVPAFRLGELPLYWMQDFRLGVVNRRFDEDMERYHQLELYRDGIAGDGTKLDLHEPLYSVRSGDDYGYFFRAFGETRLEAPLALGPAAVLKPWVGARYGYFSDTYGDPIPYAMLSADDKAARRAGQFTPGQVKDVGGTASGALMAGVDLSTRTYMLFGDQERWRWILDPTIGFATHRSPSEDPRVLYPIDVVETYDKESFYSAGFNSRIQTKSGGAPRNVLTFSAFLRYYPYTADQYRRNYGRDFTETSLDAIWNVTNRLSFWGNARIDPARGQVNYSQGGVNWWMREWFRVYAYHTHIGGDRSATEPYHPAYDETVFAIRNKLWNDHSRYSSEIAVTYDWKLANYQPRRGGLAEYRVTLFRNMWDDFELALTYAQNRRQYLYSKYSNEVASVDKGFYVSFAQTGVAGVRRPDPVSQLASSHITESRYAYEPRLTDDEAALQALRAEEERRMGLPPGAGGAGAFPEPSARSWDDGFGIPAIGGPLGGGYY